MSDVPPLQEKDRDTNSETHMMTIMLTVIMVATLFFVISLLLNIQVRATSIIMKTSL